MNNTDIKGDAIINCHYENIETNLMNVKLKEYTCIRGGRGSSRNFF